MLCTVNALAISIAIVRSSSSKKFNTSGNTSNSYSFISPMALTLSFLLFSNFSSDSLTISAVGSG
ncbi:hypothetical protein F220043C3_16530 [Enterocloster asparagiformis]